MDTTSFTRDASGNGADFSSLKFQGVDPTIQLAANIASVASGAGGLARGGVALSRLGLKALARSGDEVVSTADNFIGPTIGRSRFRSPQAFADAVGVRYQQYIDDAFVQAIRLEDAGQLTGLANTRIGRHVDRASLDDLRAFLNSERILEGKGGLIQLDRALGNRRPDVRIPAAGRIFDGTVGGKTFSSPQVIDFIGNSGGNTVTILRPTKLGGSHSVF